MPNISGEGSSINQLNNSQGSEPSTPGGLATDPVVPNNVIAGSNAGNVATASQGNQLAKRAPHSADPEKQKMIQQQLVLLLHAHNCQRREKDLTQSGGQVSKVCLKLKLFIVHQ